ncbi:MAG TPA: hypothetical protein VGV59_16695 [Pyrinomonadaceae bacterium]|nr:hypothetical protein [Pyrinomonadaceae bacterium]
MRKWLLACLIISISIRAGAGQQATVAPEGRVGRQEAEEALHQLPGQIKLMDEPTIRVLLRLRLANFLWKQKEKTAAQTSKEAEALIAEAVGDFKAHADEIPALYSSTLRSELLAAIKLRAPELAQRLGEDYKVLENDSRDQLHSAYAMLREKSGVAPAIEVVRNILRSGKDPGTIILYILERLQQESPTEITNLLSAILGVEEQNPGSLTIDTLFWTQSYYLAEQTPAELKARFLAVVIKTIEQKQTWTESQNLSAYRLLSGISATTMSLMPALYPRGRYLSAVITSRLPISLRDRLAAEERIRESTDKLNQLIIEGNAATNTTLKEDFLSQAAQMALAKKQLRQAADLALATSAGGERGIWRDQLLSDVVSQALEKKDTALAEDIAPKIGSGLSRAAALQKIALSFFALKDVAHARELLHQAAKLVAATDNNPAKVRYMLMLAAAFSKVDEAEAPETLRATVKVINSVSLAPPPATSSDETRKLFAQSLTQMAWNIIPTFQRLSFKDEARAFSLANEISSKDLRGAAIFGVSTGILQANNAVETRAQNQH